MCCEPLAVEVLRKGYQELENTGPVIAIRTGSDAVVGS